MYNTLYIYITRYVEQIETFMPFWILDEKNQSNIMTFKNYLLIYETYFIRKYTTE